MVEKRSLIRIFSLILALTFLLCCFISTPKVAAFNYPEIKLGDNIKEPLVDVWDGKFYQFKIDKKQTVQIKYSSNKKSIIRLYTNNLETIFTVTNTRNTLKTSSLEQGNYIIGIYNNSYEKGFFELSLSSNEKPPVNTNTEPDDNLLQSISFSSDSYYLELGDSLSLPIIKTPSNIKKPKISFRSSRPKIVSVTKKGRVKSNRMGKAVITAKIEDKTAVCTVYVNKKTISVLNKSRKTLPRINGKKVEWQSENESVAKVVKNSIVGVSQGATVFKATVDSTDYYVNAYCSGPKKLSRLARKKLKSSLNSGSSLIVFHRYKGYNSEGTASVTIDYAIKTKDKIHSRGYIACSYNTNFELDYYYSNKQPKLLKQKEF